jgi:hypothetical protein
VRALFPADTHFVTFLRLTLEVGPVHSPRGAASDMAIFPNAAIPPALVEGGPRSGRLHLCCVRCRAEIHGPGPIERCTYCGWLLVPSRPSSCCTCSVHTTT